MTKIKQTVLSEANFSTSGDKKLWRRVFCFLLGLTILRLVVVAWGGMDLSGDEAHYWEWSRRLDLSYYSKPPGVAWLVKLGTMLWGDTELGVRFMAPVLSFLSSMVMYWLASRWYDRRTGAWTAVLFQVLPFYSAYGMGITPDTPLLFFWLLSLCFLYEAWSRGSGAAWAGLAVSLGLGLLCKYAIIFFYVPAILLLALTATGRQRLKTPWPYVSLVSAFLFFTPVVIWNSRHNWVMFRHDLGHTKVAEGFHFTPMNLLEYVGGQLGLVTPIVAVLILWLVIRGRRQNPFAFWMTLPILAGFLLKSVQGKIQPNWPMTAWLAALPVVVDFYLRRFPTLNIHWRRVLTAGLIIPAVGTLFLHVPFLLEQIPWPQGKQPLKNLMGWKELGQQAGQLQKGMDQPCFIFSDYYQYCSELAFYVEGQPVVYYVNRGRRMNQYDLWPGFGDRVGENAIYVTRFNIDAGLQGAFAAVERIPFVYHDRWGKVVREMFLYRCRGFKGWNPQAPENF